jgi:diaminohydroxyphosphoribosylaminopyrimidine deaminase / 5-amino-6-(5-phosphoribosylamino)uracil reductase
MNHNRRFLLRALALAEKGRGFVSPNPTVGACVVRSGRLISEGYHRAFGSAHAEVEALGRAGRKAKGATLYVTLEPCSIYGKTPPCVEAIRDAGIKRVVIGGMDPNPIHKGRAVTILERYGIKTKTDVIRDEVARQIQAYAKWVRVKKPFVTLKLAQSLDGKIASRTGDSRWISGPEARLWVHDIRSDVDAILVGKNTVLKDNPKLTTRNGKPAKAPWRIVLDAEGACHPEARIFHAGGPTLLACSRRHIMKIGRKFRTSKVTLMPLREKERRLDLNDLLEQIGLMGITSLLVEGGGEVAWSFLKSRLVDKVFWIIAPQIVGGRRAKTSVEGLGVRSLSEAHSVRVNRMFPMGKDFIFEGQMESSCFQES